MNDNDRFKSRRANAGRKGSAHWLNFDRRARTRAFRKEGAPE